MLKRKHVYTWLTVLLLSCLSHVWAQSNINIVNNNITIRAALYEIEKQSGYSVGFDETDLDVEKNSRYQSVIYLWKTLLNRF